MKLARWTMAVLAAAMVVGLAGASLSRAEDAAAATGTITGKVVDKDSNPVKGATVQAYTPADKAAGTKPVAVGKSTTSADDGTFKLESVPVGKYIVMAKNDTLRGRSDAKNLVEVTADKEAKVADPIKMTAGRQGGGGGGGKN